MIDRAIRSLYASVDWSKTDFSEVKAGPWDDTALLESPEEQEPELQEMAKRCAVTLRRTVYTNPWV
jgi:hypothetical protein